MKPATGIICSGFLIFGDFRKKLFFLAALLRFLLHTFYCSFYYTFYCCLQKLLPNDVVKDLVKCHKLQSRCFITGEINRINPVCTAFIYASPSRENKLALFSLIKFWTVWNCILGSAESCYQMIPEQEMLKMCKIQVRRLFQLYYISSNLHCFLKDACF